MEVKKSSLLKFFLSMSILSLLIFPATAESFLLGWDLVDSGKHLDYDGDSKFMMYVDTGASIWNNYKRGVIRRDSLVVVQDVFVSDMNEVSTTVGRTSRNGTILLNCYHLDDASDSQRTNTAAHELGHALGIGHTPENYDLMYSEWTRVTSLSKNDKAAYDEAYSKY